MTADTEHDCGIALFVVMIWGLLAVLVSTSCASPAPNTTLPGQVELHCRDAGAVLDCSRVRGRMVYKWDFPATERVGFDDE